MRVAIIHYWLVGMRGGERVLEQLCMMFPDADIYTHVADPAKLPAAEALLACARSDDIDVRTLACATLQNLCNQPEWASVVVASSRPAASRFAMRSASSSGKFDSKPSSQRVVVITSTTETRGRLQACSVPSVCEAILPTAVDKSCRPTRAYLLSNAEAI